MSQNHTWLEIRELAEALFCSVKSVYIYRDKNLFKAGTHYYSVGEGKQRGKHIYNLELCRKALLERTAKDTRLNETYDDKEIRKIIDRKVSKKKLSYGSK
tara:strand:- start:10240 stop:10539 length:300 start_codon:yes stop_codon:yes gene_type:complete